MTSTWHINESLDLWLQHEYKSERKRYSTVQTAGDSAIIYNATNNKLKGYNLFNLGASYVVNDQLRFNGAVNNLLDKDFTSNGTYIDANGNPASYYDYMSLVQACLVHIYQVVTFGYLFLTTSKIAV